MAVLQSVVLILVILELAKHFANREDGSAIQENVEHCYFAAFDF